MDVPTEPAAPAGAAKPCAEDVDTDALSAEAKEIVRENRQPFTPSLPDDFEAASVDEAQKILEVFEIGARNMQAKWDDSSNNGHVKAHHSLMTKLKFLRDSAHSMKWAAGFLKLLNRAHSMRVRVIHDNEKQFVRKIAGCCQVCGTREHQCNYTFELLGSSVACVECDNDLFESGDDGNDGYSASMWLDAKPDQLRFLHDDFVNGFDVFQSEEWMQMRKFDDKLPLEYLGMFAVGETCLQKTKLAFFTQNVPMELSYDAHSVLSDYEDIQLKEHQFVTATHDSAKELLLEVEKVETALRTNNNNAALPAIAECQSAWFPVSEIIEEQAQMHVQASQPEVVEVSDWEDGEIDSEGEVNETRRAILLLCGKRGQENLQLETNGRDEREAQTRERKKAQAKERQKKKQKKQKKKKRRPSSSSQDDHADTGDGDARPRSQGHGLGDEAGGGDQRAGTSKRRKRHSVILSENEGDSEQDDAESQDSNGFSNHEMEVAIAHSFASSDAARPPEKSTGSASASSSAADALLPVAHAQPPKKRITKRITKPRANRKDNAVQEEPEAACDDPDRFAKELEQARKASLQSEDNDHVAQMELARQNSLLGHIAANVQQATGQGQGSAEPHAAEPSEAAAAAEAAAPAPVVEPRAGEDQQEQQEGDGIETSSVTDDATHEVREAIANLYTVAGELFRNKRSDLADQVLHNARILGKALVPLS